MPFEIDNFRKALRQGGVAAALQYLNAPVPHRYTGIYQLKSGLLISAGLHDKAGEVLPGDLMEVPLVDSFCQFVLRDGSFRTEDSGVDGRLDGHKYKGVVLSYSGVPILGNDGELWGTLCHFDTLNRRISDDEYEFLRKSARYLPEFLPK
jgi:GAF domain-containing protein